MKRNTVVELLRLLSKEEITRLGKFLQSPYFNNSKLVVVLFEQYRRLHPAYSEKQVKPEKFWEKLHPGKPYVAQKYWWLAHKLRGLIEQFLVSEESTNDQRMYKRQLINAYRKRNAQPLFEKESLVLLDHLHEQPFQDFQYYADCFWLKHDYFFNPSTDKYGKAKYSVEDAMQDLDRFYLLAKLRLSAEIKTREALFSKKVPIRLLEECQAASVEFTKENVAFLIYQKVLELFHPKKAVSAYWEGKQLLEEQHAHLSKYDQHEVMLNLRNYAIRQLHKGGKRSLSELFELYQLGIKLDLLIVDGKISESNFSNMVKVACGVKEFDWAAQFITEFEPYLDEEVKADAKVQGLGFLYFEKGAYEDAISLYSQYQFTNPLHQMVTKVTILKAWFCRYQQDKQLHNLMISSIEAVMRFYKRDKNMATLKKAPLIHFVQALRQLVVLINKKESSKKIRAKMEAYLNGEKELVAKGWLQQMVQES